MNNLDILQKTLKQLGLTETESKVLNFCFLEEKCDRNLIAQKFNLHRVTVYQIIKKLYRSGFLQLIRSAGTKIFVPLNSAELLNKIQEQKEILEKAEKVALSLPLINQSSKDYEPQTNIITINNREAVLQLLKGILEPKTTLMIIYGTEPPQKLLDCERWEKFIAATKKMKMKLKILIPPTPNYNFLENLKTNNILTRTIKNNNLFLFTTTIISDSSIIHLTTENNITAIKITSLEICSSYKAIFDYLWNILDNLPQKSLQQSKLKDRMVYIPAGIFETGEENLKRKVYTEAFYMDATPVTNLEYQKFIKDTQYPPPPHWHHNQFPRGKGEHPIVNVSLEDAQMFAQWAGKRLPTEIEWEKAARGKDGRIYPWGNKFNPAFCNILRKKFGTTKVKSYPLGRSYFGLYDMAGNVWEWTITPYEKESQRFVIKGGSWSNNETTAQCAYRTGEYYYKKYDNIGFRCVKIID